MPIDEKAADAVFQQFKHVKPRLNRAAIGLLCATYEAAKEAGQPVGCREAFEKQYGFPRSPVRPDEYRFAGQNAMWKAWQAAWECRPERESSERPYPQLLSEGEKRSLLLKAEMAWEALQENNLGGLSGINRPFFILNEFKEVIEEYGKRDVGLTWSCNDLQKAKSNVIEDGASS